MGQARKDLSTDTEHKGGPGRNSDAISAMEMARRGWRGQNRFLANLSDGIH